ncbi:MAG: hypothetical protein KDA33_13865, partial [Phycisphaerales bacterium]|nr:hypothetical protein [Phycisphaerales bacterium]
GIMLSDFEPANEALPGDLNCDGSVDGRDVAAMTTALRGGASEFQMQYPDCDSGRTDLNGDGQTDAADITFLVDLLL